MDKAEWKILKEIADLEKVPQGRVLITSLGRALDAVRGKAGTVITA